MFVQAGRDWLKSLPDASKDTQTRSNIWKRLLLKGLFNPQFCASNVQKRYLVINKALTKRLTLMLIVLRKLRKRIEAGDIACCYLGSVPIWKIARSLSSLASTSHQPSDSMSAFLRGPSLVLCCSQYTAVRRPTSSLVTVFSSTNTPTTHSSVSPCLLTIHPTVCLYSLRVLLKSDDGIYKTGCSLTRTSRRHLSLALLISCVPPTQSSHRYASLTLSYRWPTRSKCSVSCSIAVWLSTNTLWRWPGRAVSMHKPSAIYAFYCRPIWHRHWLAVWSWRDWTTATRYSTARQSAASRSCSVCRTVQPESSSRHRGGPMPNRWCVN